ncbi:MAG: YbaB/EbfC family nucleoid-associated protein [Spirochaetaceae bacterium]|jgi:DNA-binding YbaB/EbfC family protein|nr:YbaB/EbfC family nucleoid-associated protein [Spirochaetaceae bacterium]
MDINPFDLFKNAQKFQEQMGSLQTRLGDIRATGSSGGGMVELDINGKMELKAVRITPEAMEFKDNEMLQDLILAAFTSAMEKMKEAINAEVGTVAGNLEIPGLS